MNKKIWSSLMALWLVAFSFLAVSCIAHIHGNGKVVKEERSVAGFDEVSVSTGIEVLINQDSFEKVVVEADENIQKILKTEVAGSKLKIYLDESVWHAKQMKVYVTLKQLKSLETSAGAEVKSGNKISAGELKINSSSGSGAKMEVACTHLSAGASSGSSLKIWGTTQSFTAHSSSGAGIHASELVAEKGSFSSSSGAHIDAQVTKEVRADASSGASINLAGNPSVRDTDSSSGGSVHFR